MFSESLRTSIEGYLGRYETRRSSILPILHAIQDEKDWISPGDVELLDREFGLPSVDVLEVLSFYTMYRTSPPKPFRFQVCNSISCWLQGSAQTLRDLTSAVANDPQLAQRVECAEVECLGLCGSAPVALINKDRHERVDPAKALALAGALGTAPLPKAAQVCAGETP